MDYTTLLQVVMSTSMTSSSFESTTSTSTSTNNNNNNIMMMNIHDDVMPLRIVFCVAFFIYILSLVTLGRCSITHQWLFSNLTTVQPTVESISSIIQSLSLLSSARNNNASSHVQTTAHNNDHHQSFHNNVNNNRNRTTHQRQQQQQHHQQQQQERRTYDEVSSSLKQQQSNEVLEDQLSILEFSTMKIQPGVIALQQYRRLRNNSNSNSNNSTNNNNNNQRIIRTSNDTTTNDTTNEAFVLWKYLETAVLSCIALFAILILRWLSHVRNCQYLATILHSTLVTLQQDFTTKQNRGHRHNHHNYQMQQQHYREVLYEEWTAVSTTVESNNARWWLMLFIVLTCFTWFHLTIMARSKLRTTMNAPGVRYYYSPYSWFCGITVAYYVWRHIRTNQNSTDDDLVPNITNSLSLSSSYSWYTIDDALDELSSRILLLARIFGWKMDGQVLWDIIRRSVRIMVTLFCGMYGSVIADPIWTLQEAMVYRLYVGSGNDIQYNQKGIRNSSSRWRNIRSKRVLVMETLWKIIVIIALVAPVVNLLYTYRYGLDHSFTAVGSRRLIIQITYVIVLCILVRKFQQDYLLSALPAAVILLRQYNHNNNNNDSSSSSSLRMMSNGNESSSTRNNNNNRQQQRRVNHRNHNNQNNNNNHQQNRNNNNNDNNNEDAALEEDEDLHYLLRYPFAIRIETILQYGTKLVCIPLLLTVLFGINHISDFQRGQTTFPSPYGGPWRSHRTVQQWHQNRTLSQISTFLEPSLMTISTNKSPGNKHQFTAVELLAILSYNDTASACEATTSNRKSNNFVERLFRISKDVTWQSIIGSAKYRQNAATCTESTPVPSLDLKAIAFQPLNKTLPSALRKLQKLAKASLKDNNIRACFTGYHPRSRSLSKHQNTKEQSEQELLFQIAQKKVNETTNELWEVIDAISHHPLITAETVYTLSRFLELILCLVWAILVLPFLVMTSHKSMVHQRWAFLQLNASALHANPQDADD